MRVHRHLTALTLLAAVLLQGCSRSVEVAPAAEGTSAACTRIAWPQAVAGRDRRDTTPESPSTAAWGPADGPVIIARCGMPPPGPTQRECLAVDDVDWIAEKLDDGMRFTTYGRRPAVEVLVPSRYAPEPLVLSTFAAAAKAGASTGHRCR